MTERCDEIRTESADREHDAQGRYKRQVLELSQRHQVEADTAHQRHQGELWRTDDARKREIREKDDKYVYGHKARNVLA